ncbi:hypothetical protein CPB83DRAFT_858663 [Crepidotus variabilis]|uniref:BTB domain-containing protein n=1 Tax=Crepidotus variabilis TaxID=179855 RepID=A0A9P6JMA7_9AGAR|nr:hypothetical protein CPB83DRAFT_858663 [Crepidotus variabilis]
MASSTILNTTTSIRVHPDFDQNDSDLTIQSSDGIQFRLKRCYLAATTGAFPGTEIETLNEITYLTESSSVLTTLFQFTYPRKHPWIRDLSFSEMAAVAESAEKYQVFAAMNVCHMRMSEFLPEHGAEILTHAVKHDYPDLVELVIPLLARADLIKTLEKLPLAWALPWCRFSQAWNKIFDEVLNVVFELPESPEQDSCNNPSSTNTTCNKCRFTLIKWIREVKNDQTLTKLWEDCEAAKELYKSEESDDSSMYYGQNRGKPLCKTCFNTCLHLNYVVEELEQRMNAIPPFKTFI